MVLHTTKPPLYSTRERFGFNDSQDAAEQLGELIDKAGFKRPLTSVILGSIGDGLINDATHEDSRLVIPRDDLAHMPIPMDSVKGHAGEIIVAPLKENEDISVLFWSGRLHTYQQLAMRRAFGLWHQAIDRRSQMHQDAVTFPISINRAFGIQDSMSVSSVGSVNPDLTPGTFGVIKDQIHPTGLGGAPDERWYKFKKEMDKNYNWGKKDRFPAQNDIHNAELANIIMTAANNAGITLQEAVYYFAQGPLYESNAECKLIKASGADIVGMSAANEAKRARTVGFNSGESAARHTGIFNVTNLAQFLHEGALDHAEVGENSSAKENREKFSRFMTAALEAIHEDQARRLN